jgi:hypothetical protein
VLVNESLVMLGVFDVVVAVEADVQTKVTDEPLEVVGEGVVDFGADGVDVAPRARRQRQVIVVVDAEGVDEGS